RVSFFAFHSISLFVLLFADSHHRRTTRHGRLAKKRVSVVVNWSSLKEEDLEELEDDGWILDDVDSKQDPSSADGGEAEAEQEEDEGPEQQVASPDVAHTAQTAE